MAALLYIPISDPFAVFGIILLFALIIIALVLLIFTARRSAQHARKAVYDQARYQRLLQLHLKEEQRAFETEAKMSKRTEKEKVQAGPSIIVTAPSNASLRSAGAGKGGCARKTASNLNVFAIPRGYISDDQDNTTSTTSLLNNHQQPDRHKHPAEHLPRPLRVGE